LSTIFLSSARSSTDNLTAYFAAPMVILFAGRDYPTCSRKH
jgi:hypothetical protein